MRVIKKILNIVLDLIGVGLGLWIAISVVMIIGVSAAIMSTDPVLVVILLISGLYVWWRIARRMET